MRESLIEMLITVTTATIMNDMTKTFIGFLNHLVDIDVLNGLDESNVLLFWLLLLLLLLFVIIVQKIHNKP